MQNVLADLALESEAATTLFLRLGRAISDAGTDPAEAALARIGTAIGKYWICKRTPGHIYEAMECHGGPGYIEETILPRLYREAPVNSIWEGSGNVICLDVLRALYKDPGALPAFFAEVERAKGGNRNLDLHITRLKAEVDEQGNFEARARRITEMMALAWQAALLVQHAPSAASDAFCASRLGNYWSGAYGTLPEGIDFTAILKRAGASL